MAKSLGQSGDIVVSSATYPVAEWSIAVSNETQDVTDTSSGGWQENIGGINSAEITFRAFWGSSAALLSTTFAIGTAVTATLKIGATAKTFVCTGYVQNFRVVNNAKSPIEFEGTLRSTGTVTMPS